MNRRSFLKFFGKAAAAAPAVAAASALPKPEPETQIEFLTTSDPKVIGEWARAIRDANITWNDGTANIDGLTTTTIVYEKKT